MSKYERLSIILAALALVFSVSIAFKAIILDFFFVNTPKVFVENRIGIGNRFGSPLLFPVVTVANEGTTELTLGRIEGELKFQSGNALKLSADNYFKQGASFYLREVTVKPGETWSERPNISEVLPQNREDEFTKIEQLTFDSARKKRMSSTSSTGAMLEMLVEISDMDQNAKAKVDPVVRRAKLTEMISKFEERRAPLSVDANVIEKARQLFDLNISRFEKGQHALILRLFNRADKMIWEGAFDFVLYEEQVQQFRSSLDRYGQFYVSENNSYQPIVLTPPTVRNHCPTDQEVDAINSLSFASL